MEVLSIQNLSKRYKKVRALNQLSLSVSSGCVYGILGPNGSGKTTTLGILLGVINADEGTFSWLEKGSSKEIRRQIGSILETPNFYPYLSAYNNLRISSAIKEVPESSIEGVLKIVKLWDRKNDKFKTYSLGMKQRLSIAAALLGDPQVLVLDEPTNGLDPQGIAEVRELIIELGNSGKTIILASHMLDEVEKVCTHVAVIKKGNLLAEGAVSDILTQDDRLEVSAADMENLKQVLSGMNAVRDIKLAKDHFVLTVQDGFTGEHLNKLLFDQGIIANHVTTKKKSLEDQFLEMTQ